MKKIVIPKSSLKLSKEENAKQNHKYYRQNYAGKHVVNDELGIPIKFRRIVFDATWDNKIWDVAFIHKLPEMVKNARVTSVKARKWLDIESIIAFFNFKVNVEINGKIKTIRFNVILERNGKFLFGIWDY